MAYLEMYAGTVALNAKEDYSTSARAMGALTMKADALSVSACWGVDFPEGMLKSLASAVKIEPGEALVTRFVRWKSKEARDAGWAQMMKTPDLQAAAILVPFDRTRVYYGGFEELDG